MKSKKSKSKKHSTTKESSSEQLKDFVFFVDRSSGRYELGEGLQNLGLQVETHDTHFSETTIDIDWILHCGEKEWIVVSSDLHIAQNELERRAIFYGKVAAFFFASNNITSSKQVEIFTRALPKIANLVINQTKPFIAKIYLNGKVILLDNFKSEKREERIQKRQGES